MAMRREIPSFQTRTGDSSGPLLSHKFISVGIRQNELDLSMVE